MLKKRAWPNLRKFPCICLKTEKTTQIIKSGQLVSWSEFRTGHFPKTNLNIWRMSRPVRYTDHIPLYLYSAH